MNKQYADTTVIVRKPIKNDIFFSPLKKVFSLNNANGDANCDTKGLLAPITNIFSLLVSDRLAINQETNVAVY